MKNNDYNCVMKFPSIIDHIDNTKGPIALDVGNVILKWNPGVFIKAFIDGLCVFTDDQPTKILPDPTEWLGKVQPLQDLGISNVRDQLDLHFPKVHSSILDAVASKWIETIEFNSAMTFKVEEWISCRKVALLSNMGHNHLDWLRINMPSIFGNTIQHISCEVGARKPTKLFYQSFLLEHPDFYGAIYLDDLQPNVVAARAAGFDGFIFHIDSLM